MKKDTSEFQWINDLNLELEGSDRSCVILAGAILDERLKLLIQKFILPSSDTKHDKLLGRSAPLESFSSRIELASRLNLISENHRKSLSWVRDIRNAAAHKECFSLESNSYKDKIENIISENNIEEQTPSLLKEPYHGAKGNFIAIVLMMVMTLDYEIKETEQTKHQPINLLSSLKDSEENA